MRVLKEKPRMPKELRESAYQWLALMPRFKTLSDEENVDAIAKLCQEKVKKGLL